MDVPSRGDKWSWEFDAPRFYDFAKLSSNQGDMCLNDEEYFNVDHEMTQGNFQEKQATKEKVICETKDNKSIAAKSDGIPSGNEGIGVPKIKQQSTTTNLCKTEHNPDATALASALEEKPSENEDKENSMLVSNLAHSALPRSGNLTEDRILANQRSRSPNRRIPEKSRCRQVDEVTSTKKRLSMSVDRGRDKMRLLSPSPPRERRTLIEREESSSIHRPQNRSTPIPKQSKSVQFHPPSLHKMRATSSNWTIITEDGDELAFVEVGIVKGLIENNEEAVEDEKRNRSFPVPHTGVPFQPLCNQRFTQLKPFSFEEKTRQMIIKKEEKIKKILDEEKKARVFHAQPFPEIMYASTLPKKPQQQPSQKATFRAKPASVLQKEPFVPLKTSKHTTDFAPLSLNTKQRAEQRAAWEKQKRGKEAQVEQERLERERQKQELEQKELRELRAALVHKAQPVRQYKPVNIVCSDRQATVPKAQYSRKSNAL